MRIVERHADLPDLVLEGSRRGIRAVLVSLAALGLTALGQLLVVLASGSVALLADTVHNAADALTAVPLLIAFRLARRPPSRRYPYGLLRAEDLAGVVIVLTIAASACLAAIESVRRLLEPRSVEQLPWVAAAGAIGFLGNEGVAWYRIRVGRRIGSAALVADGLHARTDGLTSLGVLGGAAGTALGLERADPIAGLAITAVIGLVLWHAARSVLRRLLDGTDDRTILLLEETAAAVPGVEHVTSAKARWTGHVLNAELEIQVDPSLTVEAGHRIAEEVEHALLHRLPRLAGATVHVDPHDHHPPPGPMAHHRRPRGSSPPNP